MDATQQIFESDVIKHDEIQKFWTWFYVHNAEMQKRYGLVDDYYIDKRGGGSLLQLAAFVQQYAVEYARFEKIFTQMFVDAPLNQEYYLLCLSSDPKSKSVWFQSVAKTLTHPTYVFVESAIDKTGSQHFGTSVNFKPCFMLQFGKGHFGPRKPPVKR
jgi:hypothetical protein